jgi:hypothetical protein
MEKENPLHSTTQMIAQAKATEGGHLSVGRGGLPYQREHFAQDHPDIFALLEPGKGENFRQ